MADLIKIVLGSALGAGIVVSLVQYSLSMRKERWQRKRDFLLQQLQLYGPAHSLVCRLLHAEKRIDGLWHAKQEYEQEQLAVGAAAHTAPAVQDRREVVPQKVRATVQRYRKVIKENHEDLYNELNKNLHFLDPDDVPLARQFFVDYNVADVEDPGDATKALPPEVVAKLGPSCLIRPEFTQRIREKLETKQRKLSEMVEPPATVIQWVRCRVSRRRKRE